MPLTEYLTLSPEEIKTQNEILKNIPPLEEKLFVIKKYQLYKMIVEFDPEHIIKLSITNPKVHDFLKIDLFESYWNDLWAQYGIKSENLPIPTISSMNLVKGMYIYDGYRKALKKEEMSAKLYLEAKKFLILAANYGCFFALNALCTEGIKLLLQLTHQKNFNSEAKELSLLIFKNIIQYAKKAAELYWTPGYFLLANMCQELTVCINNIFDKQEQLVVKESLFKDAMEALIVAEKLHPHSSIMIQHAYQGKTLKEATRGEFKSFPISRDKLVKASGGLIKMKDLEELYRNAHILFDKIIEKYPTIEPTLSLRKKG